MPRFVAFHLIALRDTVFVATWVKRVYWLHFPAPFALFLSLSHFSKSHNSSKKCYCYICNGTCDPSSLMLQLQNDYYSLEGQMTVSIFSKEISLIIVHF